MTLRQQTIITIDEITSLRFCCRHCHSVIECSPEQWQKIPLTCPNCEVEWIHAGTAEMEALRLLCKALDNSKNAQKNVNCDISLALAIRQERQPI